MLISWPIEPCAVDDIIHVKGISHLVKTEVDGMKLFDPQFTGGIIDLLSDDQDEEVTEKVAFPEDLAKENTSELCLSSTATEVSGLYCYAYFLALNPVWSMV